MPVRTTSAVPALGPVAHVGVVVADLHPAAATLGATGVRWSTVLEPEAVLRLADGRIVRERVRYVAQAGGEPRLKLIGASGTGWFVPEPGGGVHHLSHWVDDLAGTTAALEAVGYRVEATGLELRTLAPRYVYLAGPGLPRVEIGLTANRAEFDAWADGGA